MRFSTTLHDSPTNIRQRPRRRKTSLHLEHDEHAPRERLSKVFGYRLREDGKLEIIPEEAEMIRLIFRRVTEGRSLKEIKTEMDLHNFCTRFGNRWSIPQIKAFILHYPEVHPCIVAPAIVQKAIRVVSRMSESTFDPTIFFRD